MKEQQKLKEIRETAELILHLTKKLSDSGIYPVSIPARSSNKSLIAAGHFNLSVGPELTQKTGLSTNEAATFVFIKLFCLSKEIVDKISGEGTCTDFINSIIIPFLRNRRGYRHASVAEILALGAQYPDLQKNSPITTLGRGFRWDDENHDEPLKYPRLTVIKYPDRTSRVFDWLINVRPEELAGLRFAMVVK